LADRARDPEITHDRTVAMQQYVLRLDIAVDHPSRVRVGKRVGDVMGDSEGVLE
jgi:hypothetical protein